MALVDAGRGNMDDLRDFWDVAEYHSKSGFHTEYLIEKLGHGYFERALSRFGVKLKKVSSLKSTE